MTPSEQRIAALTRNVELARMQRERASMANVFGLTPEQLIEQATKYHLADVTYWKAVKSLEREKQTQELSHAIFPDLNSDVKEAMGKI